MDAKYGIASINRAIDIVSGLVQSYDKIDEYIGNLRFVEAAQILTGCYADITSLSNDSELEEEIQVCCASLRSKCIDEVTEAASASYGDLIAAEIDDYQFKCRFFDASMENFDINSCNDMYNAVLVDLETKENQVIDEANQCLHTLKSGWINRYGILVKLALLVAKGCFTFSEQELSDGDRRVIEVNGKRTSISYGEFDDLLVTLNMYDTYLRFMEKYAMNGIIPAFKLICGYKTEDTLSLDYIYNRVLSIDTPDPMERYMSIENFSSTSEVVSSIVQNIVVVHTSLQRLIKLAEGSGTDGKFNNTSVDMNVDYGTMPITNFRCLSRAYGKVFIEELISKAIHEVFPCWELENGTLSGLIKVLSDIYHALVNAGITMLDSSSRFVGHFLRRAMTMLEEHVLVFTRYCAREQCDETIFSKASTDGAALSRVNCIRKLNKDNVNTLISVLLANEMDGINHEEVVKRIQWNNQIEPSCVSNCVYSLSSMLYMLAEGPASLLYHVSKSSGKDIVSHRLMEDCVSRYSNIVESVISVYVVMTQDMFKQFVLRVTRTLIKDEDAKDIIALKESIVTFLLFLSNAVLMSHVTLSLPYLAQEAYNQVSSHVEHTYDDPEIHGSKLLSQSVKAAFHTFGAHVNLLKIQDYLLAQFTAFTQQILQKLLSRLLNDLTDESTGLGDDLLQLFTLSTSLCEQILPKKVSNTAVALVVDLHFATVPDLVLDYLDLLSYQPSEAVLSIISEFVINLETTLTNCMIDLGKTEDTMVNFHKFRIFAGVFRHDFSYMDFPNPPYNHRDLGRLSKMSKCMQSRMIQT